jgi:DNA polymerase III sliding clamp (beta) subunit (PCNA family)
MKLMVKAMTEIFDRKELANKLATVAPALSDGKIIKILDHFWFTGKELMTFNDTLAIAVPFKTQFVGALPSTLSKYLATISNRETVQLTRDDMKVKLTVPKSPMKITLAMMAAEDFTFTWPAKPNKVNLAHDVDKDFRAALKTCLRSLGNDGQRPETRGVTVLADKKGGSLYTTDSATMSTAVVANMKSAADFRAIMPGAFCTALAGSKGDGKLVITDSYCEFVENGNELKLFGRLLETSDPIDFASLIDRHISSEQLASAIAIPKNLSDALNRAKITAEDSTVGRPETMLNVTPKGLKITAVATNATDDFIAFKGHPEVFTKCDARRLLDALDDFQHIYIGASAIALLSETATHLVSSHA